MNFWEDLKSGRFASMVNESSKGQSISNSREIYNIMKPIFGAHDDVETVYGIFLDVKNRIIAIGKLSSGSINTSVIYPREVVKKILDYKASAIILSHNHPSGDTSPSREDRAMTVMLGLVLYAMNVTVHDHIIVGDGYHSMADSGYIEKNTEKFRKLLHRMENETEV